MQQDMTKGSILPLLLKFTIPLFIGNVFQQLYNMADSIIVGRFVGQKALAAVGSTGTLMFLIIGFAQGITSGFTVLTAQRFGAHDEDGVRRSVANGILLSVLFTIGLTLVFVLALPGLLHLMNTPKDIYRDALTYIMTITEGLFAVVFYNLFSSMLRAVGNSKAPLFFLVFSAILNVFLDLFFIIHFHMGVFGAAFATVLSQAVSAFFCGIYMIHSVRILIPKRSQWRLYGSVSANQLRMGIPMALQFAITASGTMIMQAAVNLFGSTAVASYTAATKVHNVLSQGMMSMGQTMATFCGQNFGIKAIKRIKSGVACAVRIMTVYSVIAAALFYILLPLLVGIFFTGNANMSEILPWARTYCIESLLFYIPLSYIFIFRNAMQGCGYALLPTLGGVVELTARLVTAFIGMKTHSYPISVFCDPAAWLSAGIFTMVAYLTIQKKMFRQYA